MLHKVISFAFCRDPISADITRQLDFGAPALLGFESHISPRAGVSTGGFTVRTQGLLRVIDCRVVASHVGLGLVKPAVHLMSQSPAESCQPQKCQLPSLTHSFLARI